MTRVPWKVRTIRVPDKLWAAALAKADQRGETLSVEIRRFLERYTRKGTP